MKIKKVLYMIFIIGLFILVGGISYAIFVFAGTGTTENLITTGQVRVDFEEENNISINDRYPESDTEGLANTDPNSQMTFSVSGDIIGDATVNYAVGLVDIVEGATLKQDYIKIYLTKNGSVSNGFISGSGKTIKSFVSSKIDGLLDSHVIASGSITGNNVDTYVLKAWIDESFDLVNKDNSNGGNHSVTTNKESFSFKIKVVGTDSTLQIESGSGSGSIQKDSSNANVPALASNMIPVIYDSGNSTWVKADSTNKDLTWFNYTDKKWANAVTVTSTNRDTYLKATPGTPIPMSDINTMWVWIPRFSATTNGSYNGGTQSAPGAFNITFVDTNTAAHDAFDFGGAVSGFWIGKFENSSDITCSAVGNSAVGEGCNLTTIRPKILPNATSWRGAMVSTIFYDILAMTESGNQYGFDKTVDTTLDTHMLKNNEWGAVAYLTQSIYGRCTSSTSCTEVGINNNSSYVTGYGAPAGTERDTNTGTYETSLGIDASTTGNIYGVYDMSGGAYEYVMGVYWDGTKLWSGYTASSNQHSGFNGCLGSSCTSTLENGLAYPNDNKYYNLYITESDYTSSGLQHGMTETSGWFSDHTFFVNGNSPWVIRGAAYSQASIAGVFSFNSNYGLSNTSRGSRVSAIIN